MSNKLQHTQQTQLPFTAGETKLNYYQQEVNVQAVKEDTFFIKVRASSVLSFSTCVKNKNKLDIATK